MKQESRLCSRPHTHPQEIHLAAPAMLNSVYPIYFLTIHVIKLNLKTGTVRGNKNYNSK